MKVQKISYTPFTHSNNTNTDQRFMYQKNEQFKYSLKEHKWEYLGGLLAVGAAIFSLTRFATHNFTPKNIVEIADKAKGLNKLKHQENVVRQVKEQLLYPVMSVENGHWRTLADPDFNSGVLFAGKNSEEVYEALREHAKELGIHTIDIRASKKNRLKEVHKALDLALEYKAENKTNCVIVNIGDLGRASKMKASKTDSKSNLEKRLTALPRGVIWNAWTEEVRDVPYFYNNTNTLNLKIKN